MTMPELVIMIENVMVLSGLNGHQVHIDAVFDMCNDQIEASPFTKLELFAEWNKRYGHLWVNK